MTQLWLERWHEGGCRPDVLEFPLEVSRNAESERCVFLTGIARGPILNKALLGFVSYFADLEQRLIE